MDAEEQKPKKMPKFETYKIMPDTGQLKNSYAACLKMFNIIPQSTKQTNDYMESDEGSITMKRVGDVKDWYVEVSTDTFWCNLYNKIGEPSNREMCAG